MQFQIYNSEVIKESAKMNDLYIALLSKDLKNLLASQKVKTLQKAIQILPKIPATQQTKRKDIELIAKKYSNFKLQVDRNFKNINPQSLSIQSQILKGESTQEILKVKASIPFYQFLISNCICEIYGFKGSGKTSLFLHFAEQYAMAYKSMKKNVKVIIINCSGRIPNKRLEKLQKLDQEGFCIQYYEIGQIQQIYKIAQKLNIQLKQNQSKRVFLGIDMMTHFLLPKQKPKLFLTKLFKLFAQKLPSLTIVFTNLVQHKYQLGNQQLLNHASYFCLPTAEYVNNKFYLEKPQHKKDKNFSVTRIKGKKTQIFTQINESGISYLQIISEQNDKV